jgi:26S proteasome regulatory subunit, ATPase 3, interacting protein
VGFLGVTGWYLSQYPIFSSLLERLRLIRLQKDPSDAATPEELSAMDVEITTLRSRLTDLKSTLKIATSKLATLTSAPTSLELALQVEKLRTENEKKRETLEGYKSGLVKLVTTEETEKVDKEFRYWAAKRGARKMAFDALEDLFLVAMSREELWERAGIEGEE